jgi:hypothetical protein
MGFTNTHRQQNHKSAWHEGGQALSANADKVLGGTRASAEIRDSASS